MNELSPAIAALKQVALEHFRAKRFDAASLSYEEAAHLSEVPRGGLCVRLARAHLEAGRPDLASDRLMLMVDGPSSFKTWSAAAGILARCPIETWPRIRRTLDVSLTSTWTTRGFAPLLRLAAAHLGIALRIHEPDFGQYFNETLDPDSAMLSGPLDALILLPSHQALGLRPMTDTPEADIAAEVERWSSVWPAVRRRANPIIIQAGFAAPVTGPLGHFGAGVEGTRSNVISGINRELARRAVAQDVGFVDIAAMASRFGTDRWFDNRGWYMAKMPYAPEVLPRLARHVAAVLAARLGMSRRCLVLDLDNTLWGGVIGDDGIEGIVLGNGAAGEAFVDFQQAIKDLADRGIVLAVCSKNDPEVALAPFRDHPDMVLKETDIACFMAGWGAKSEMIREISERLSLGLDSLTFFDDNPYERSEVRRALPLVDVPLLPEEPTEFRRALENYPYFEPATFTAADAGRTEQYRARAQAEAIRASTGSLAEYQASLGMKATFGRVDAVSLPRVTQLINKTNQFNLTTRRRNKAEVEEFLTRPGAIGLHARLGDRFADHGLIAVALAAPVVDPQTGDREFEIDTLLMSCRVLGRGVETVIIGELARLAAEAGCVRLRGLYRPTERNGMVADLYDRLGFEELEPGAEGERRWSARPGDLGARDVPIAVNWV